jgi:hypothetical protein
MNIFHYHPETGVYLGQGLADESPLEPGVWLIPAHATGTQPPVAGESEQAIWANGAWAVEPIPAPEPEPETLPVVPAEPAAPLTPEQKLAAAGLTVTELRQLLGLPVEEETVLIRARNEDGTYKADDPSTPDVNEAYVEVPLSEA